MLEDKVASMFKDVYSKLEVDVLFGGNACTLSNVPTERNNLNIEKLERGIEAYKESIKIPVRKSSMYPFKCSDGKTYVGIAFKKVKGVKNKRFNDMLERCDLDGKCIVCEETYEYLKENHLDKFRFE